MFQCADIDTSKWVVGSKYFYEHKYGGDVFAKLLATAVIIDINNEHNEVNNQDIDSDK